MKFYTFFASARQFNKIDPDTKDWKVDSRGLRPVSLKPLAGMAPRALNVISGTTASEAVLDLTIGKCYIFQANEVTEGMKGYSSDHSHVRQFNFDVVSEIGVLDAIAEGRKDPPSCLIESTQPELEETPSV